jgi:catechol 2,3-dioxygenase-like lactoylglutathione lyase family enzyme
MSSETLRLSQLVIPVREIEPALGFYAGTLGMPVLLRDGDRYAIIDAGAVKLGLAAPSERSAERGIALGFKVADLRPLRRRLGTDLGDEPQIVEGSHELIVEVADPDGHAHLFYKPK